MKTTKVTPEWSSGFLRPKVKRTKLTTIGVILLVVGMLAISLQLELRVTRLEAVLAKLVTRHNTLLVQHSDLATAVLAHVAADLGLSSENVESLLQESKN